VGCFVVPIIPPASNVVSVGMPGVSNADQFAVYALAATMEFAEAAKTAVAKSGVNGLTRRSLHHGGRDGHLHPTAHDSPSSDLQSSEASWRQARTASATFVSVGFAAVEVGMSPLPPTWRCSTPHTRAYGSHTDSPSSAEPTRTVP